MMQGAQRMCDDGRHGEIIYDRFVYPLSCPMCQAREDHLNEMERLKRHTIHFKFLGLEYTAIDDISILVILGYSVFTRVGTAKRLLGFNFKKSE